MTQTVNTNQSLTQVMGLNPRWAKARFFIANRPAVLGVVWIAVVLVAITLGPMLSSYDPTKINALDANASFSGAHWLGTDALGRDVLTRLLLGGRESFFGASFAVAVSLVVGIPLGLLAGYIGGWTDKMISRISDVMLSLPPVVIALGVIAVLGVGTTNAMFSVGVIYSPRIIRIVRGSTLVARQATFVEASRCLGVRPIRIMTGHVLPRSFAALAVQVSVLLGAALLAEASLSFLGLGVRPPDPSWGVMLKQSFDSLRIAPIGIWPPGLVVIFTTLAFSAIGDGLLDTTEARRKR